MRFSPLSAAMISAALLPGAAIAGEHEREAVRAREAAFYTAFLQSDASAMDDIFAPSFAYQHGSGVTLSEADVLDLVRSGGVTVTRADTPELTFHDFGEVIVSYGESPVVGRAGDQPFGGLLRFVNVWKRDGETWRLHHRNSEFLPE